MPRRFRRRTSQTPILTEEDEVLEKATQVAFSRLRDQVLMIRVEIYSDYARQIQAEVVSDIVRMLREKGFLVVSLFQSYNYMYIRFVKRDAYVKCSDHPDYVPPEEVEAAVEKRLQSLQAALTKREETKELTITVGEEGVKIEEEEEGELEEEK